jgi:hypothetical protein
MAVLAATVVAAAGGEPAAAATQVSLSPAAGVPGSAFTVTGSGFAPVDVEIRWDSQSGPLLVIATGPAFSVPAVVPDDAIPNSHPVMAVVRTGNLVSTSSSSFQVTAGAPETTTTQATTTTPATVPRTSAPATTSPPTTSAATLATRPQVVAGGQSSPETLATGPPPQTADAAGVTSPASGGLADVSGRVGAPTSVARTTTTEASGDALGPRSTNASSSAVRSPALLVLGLLMAVAGAGALAVRNRRRPEPPADLPFSS